MEFPPSLPIETIFWAFIALRFVTILLALIVCIRENRRMKKATEELQRQRSKRPFVYRDKLVEHPKQPNMSPRENPFHKGIRRAIEAM